MAQLTTDPSSFKRSYYLFSLLAGVLCVFAFAPFNLYPLAWLAPAILFVLQLQAQTLKQSFLIAWLFGIGLFGVGASWPFYSMHFYAYAPILVAVAGSAIFVLLMALFSFGPFGLLSYLLRYNSVGIRLMLLYPTTWVLCEWFRGWFLTGFPWLLLGQSQIDTVFAAIAPMTGVLGVSFSSALIAGVLALLVIGLISHRGVKGIITRRTQIVSVLMLAALVGASFFLSKVNWTQQTGESITATVLQGNVPQENKFKPGHLEPTLAMYNRLSLQNRDSDLIVWPETALPDLFSRHMDSLILPLQEFTRENQNTLMIGGFYMNESGGIENSVLSLTKGGREIYSKQHLVPFGEYIPLLKYVRWLDDWIQLPYDNITRGADSDTLPVATRNGDYLAQLTVCYEDVFGEEIIASLPAAHLLVNVTNDGWFTGSLLPYQHMQIARMRSLETGRYMVRSTNTGPSGIIDEKGKLVATAPIYTTAVISHTVEIFSGSTPYVRWGNWLMVSLLSLVLVGGLWFSRNTGRHSAATRQGLVVDSEA